jgi:hypothetical protein
MAFSAGVLASVAGNDSTKKHKYIIASSDKKNKNKRAALVYKTRLFAILKKENGIIPLWFQAFVLLST